MAANLNALRKAYGPSKGESFGANAVLSLCDEIEALRAEVSRQSDALKIIGLANHNFIVGAQSAMIAGETKGAEEGMRWLHNLLWGPGLLPSDEDLTIGAQAYSDTNMKY